MAELVASNKEALSELDTLIPDRTLVIAGRDITIRAYSLIDSLTIRPLTKGLVADFALIITSGDAPDFEQIQDLLANYADIIPALVSVSVRQPVEWVASLSAIEGNTLLDWWWSVNADFFIQSAIRVATVQKLAGSDSVKSSPP